MILSRVAMVGAVVAGAMVGAPLAGAQPVPAPPAPGVPAPVPAPTVPAAAQPSSVAPVPSTNPAPAGAPAPTSVSAPAPVGAPAPTTASVPATVAPAATTTPAATTGRAPAPAACVPWTVSEVASGFGMLENLAFDGRGNVLLSEGAPSGGGAVRTLTATGERGDLVEDVNSPGGMVVDGSRVIFTTGNNAMSGLMNATNGTVESVDLDTGERTTLVEGLTMPNGLAQLADGDLLTTTALGDRVGITRIPAGGGDFERLSVDLGSVNGIAATADGKVVVDTSFDADGAVHVLDAADLSAATQSVPLPGDGRTNIADDLAVDESGNVYVALNGGGKVVRVDPVSGDRCDIATGLTMVSSVRFGSGTGWDSTALYATSFDGSVHKLTPPTS
ncbi:SMP-30/gluconolactonase/LRE family protein [Rhodococcus kronopolitis]|uniref:SMP-30/gluconolactonase/LRE family protein n=1 Tax=Rhodococcus kronopolitis TaxID=1460226 RepID=A0ABV9FJS6_9NOCA